MKRFAGQCILVTGAGRGLGAQVAEDFAAEGADVVINYASSDQGARETLARIEKAGGSAIICKADISSAAEVATMVSTVMKQFGRIDVLVNSSGISIDQPFLEMTEDAWDRVMAVNLKGPFLLSQTVGRHMVAQECGRIINISATTGVQARAGNANYSASKGGLQLLTQSMAIELGPHVSVNAVALGFVDSPLVRELFSEEALKEACEQVPLKRMTTYPETSAFVMMLASEGAGFVTGQTIPYDGGRVMR